ncbi:MAG: DUF192 domain-containing protein [Acidimicrobiia bacterium]
MSFRASGWLIAAVALLLIGTGLATFAVVRAVTDDECPASAEGTPLEDTLVVTESASDPFPGLTEADVAIGGQCRRLVIADSPDERGAGLRDRSDLGPYDGLLFVYDADTLVSYTMSGVPVPLDIAFYNSRGNEVDRLEMVPCEGDPASCPSYQSSHPFRFALETPAGELPAGSLVGCRS